MLKNGRFICPIADDTISDTRETVGFNEVLYLEKLVP